MLDWIKNIIKNIIHKFLKMKIECCYFNWNDRLNPHKDVILSIGAFCRRWQSISDSFEVFCYNINTYMTTSFQMNLLIARWIKLETDAIKSLIEFIKFYFSWASCRFWCWNDSMQYCGRLKMRRCLLIWCISNDITDKQFSLNQLSEIYKIPERERNSSTEDVQTAFYF
jgi:DNA polymerase-3 subunit epsilon